jgi:hypothetical protein
MADAERAQQYRYRAEDIRIMAQGAKNAATREKLLKLAAETDSVARNIERDAHTWKVVKKGPSSVAIRARQAMGLKKNHPLQLHKRKGRKGYFGEPRDLSSQSSFGKRDELVVQRHKPWLAAILECVRAWAGALRGI